MSLKSYNKKRNFKVTSEPYGQSAPKHKKPLYLIQKHAASHLHYDLRLELHGTLKSWAVPKGPSLDPSVKHLAVHVEDHPIDYGSFEGVIPPGEYGGGTVMLWDTGTWECLDENPYAAYKKGKLTFVLKGKKLKGTWKLIQIKKDPKNWLFVKADDAYARDENEYNIIVDKPNSAVSKRSLEAITSHFKAKLPTSAVKDAEYLKKLKKTVKMNKHKKTVTKVEATKIPMGKIRLPNLGVKKSIPKKISPELAFLSDEPPEGENWLHEIKLDGYRIMCFIEGNEIRLITRNHHDWSTKFPAIVNEFKRMNLQSAIIDGELVALNKEQYSDFQTLQNSIHDHDTSHLIYYAFDLLYINGHYIADQPLIDRKNLLHKIVPHTTGTIRYSDHVIHSGGQIYKKACQLNLEGIVSKRIDSTYVQSRSHDWVKVKCLKRQEFVVVGFTKPTGKRQYFGSLLLAINDEQSGLTFCGKVGTGFTETSLESVSQLLEKFKISTCPLNVKPNGIGHATWVKPKIVVEVEFTEWTTEGSLRHPSFKGIRKDKRPSEIIKEVSTKMPVEEKVVISEKSKKASLMKSSQKSKVKTHTKQAPKKIKKSSIESQVNYPFTHPEKILYPDVGITKFDLAIYYQQIAKIMLPYVINRPLTLVRCPQGQGAKCFYQKHINEIDAPGLSSVEIKEKVGKEPYLYIKDEEGLMALVQLGVLEIHTWGCHKDKIEKPDMIVLDLDPAPEVDWKVVVNAAHFIREQLELINLVSFVKTTGGKGLHIVIPIVRNHDWETIEIFTRTFADYMVSLKPELFLATMSKAKRKGKIFLDYLRNHRGSTAIAPYSTRAKDNAEISVPITWEELTPKLRPNQFNIKNIMKRVISLKSDPWENYFKIKQKLKIPK